MSLGDFQLFGNEPIDNSFKKRDYSEVDRQQGANLNDSNK